MTPDALTVCRQSIATHSKSFALASALLPPAARDETAAVYAFCRRADDAVDLATTRPLTDIVRELRTELDSVYAGAAQADPILGAFQEVVRRHRIPRHYPDELLAGMEMDAQGTAYADVDALLVYCFRVAGTVGLMMSHVFGVREPRALLHAAHLGMAMQLTNVCRDVGEDWERGRLYLPESLILAAGGAPLSPGEGNPLPAAARASLVRVVRELLARADGLYRSGEAGIPLLPFRAAVAVRTARRVYADIGRVILANREGPFTGRAVVGKARKITLALGAWLRTLFDARRRFHRADLSRVIGFHDVVPL